MFKTLIALFFFMSLSPAYALFGSGYPEDPVAHYELGMNQFESKKFKKASKTFEAFIKEHSNHDLYPTVKVKLGDSLFEREKFLEALRYYERSHLESPSGDIGPHVLFRMGLCNLKIIDKNKGQKYIPYTIAAFERFIRMYPDHSLVESAKENIKAAYKVKSEYQIEVGNYYFRHKDYCAAFNHFENVLLMEDFKTHSKVDDYIAKCQSSEKCLDEIAACDFDLTEVNARMK